MPLQSAFIAATAELLPRRPLAGPFALGLAWAGAWGAPALAEPPALRISTSGDRPAARVGRSGEVRVEPGCTAGGRLEPGCVVGEAGRERPESMPALAVDRRQASTSGGTVS